MIQKKVGFGLLSVLILLATGWWVMYRFSSSPLRSNEPIYLQNINFEYQKGFFALYKTTHADVVMFGDSHIFGINGNEALAREGVINRGIRGDVTEGFLKRLDEVYNLHPKLCFVMGGINDLYANIPVETIVKNYCKIVEGLRSQNITVIIQATLYVGSERGSYSEKNKEVTILNNELRHFALRENIRYIDINPIISENTVLKSKFTVDGLHLNALGYALWLPEIEKELVSNGL
ncbi:MAG: hypothetical protein HYZ54_03200 [Ignavibacteriae bacterium]|nr:hypothetical protein [Ignavibacteriota bacterium]